jgi:glycosyltransferase involved in cell wall biosynthesis
MSSSEFSKFVGHLNSKINSAVNSTNMPLESISEMVPSPVTVDQTKPLEKRIKLLFVSTHIHQINGYSRVAYSLIKRLSELKWLDIVHFGIHKQPSDGVETKRAYPSNVKAIDGTALDKKQQAGFAFSELPGVISSESPDIVFIYNDVSVVCGYVEEIRRNITNRSFSIWAYIDQIYPAQPQNLIDILNRDVERIFCFTDYWKRQIKEQGITRPVDVLKHGIDTSLIHTIPRDLARQQLGIPKDAFVFTSVNRNHPRKRYDLLIMSFVELIIKHPLKNIFLLIVSDKGTKGGYQLFDIFARELKLRNAPVNMFGNRMLLTSKDNGFRDEDINIFYNLSDAGVSCAEGEGFGLCSFEMMSLGIPQVVPEIGGYTDYCTDSNSILVKPKVRYYIPHAYNVITGEAQAVDPIDFANAMEKYVLDDGMRKLHGQRAKDTVTRYTWDKCTELLVKRLDQHRTSDD